MAKKGKRMSKATAKLLLSALGPIGGISVIGGAGRSAPRPPPAKKRGGKGR